MIRSCCGLCEYADIQNGVDWGTCRAVTYQHGKHNDQKRQLSINRYGTCPKFTPDEGRRTSLGAFSEFVDAYPRT